MQMYWAEGHNQSYIFLRHLIERRELSLSRTDEDHNCEFCTSFPNRSKKIWSTLSAPYMYDDDDEAFIVDDGSESFDQYERPVFEKPTNLEDEIVQHLRKKRHIPDSDDDGSDDNSGSEADELSIVENIDHHGNGIDEEDEDSLVEPHNQDLSDDEWVTNKMTAKPKHKKSSVKKTPVKKSRLSRSKLMKNRMMTMKYFQLGMKMKWIIRLVQVIKILAHLERLKRKDIVLVLMKNHLKLYSLILLFIIICTVQKYYCLFFYKTK